MENKYKCINKSEKEFILKWKLCKVNINEFVKNTVNLKLLDNLVFSNGDLICSTCTFYTDKHLFDKNEILIFPSLDSETMSILEDSIKECKKINLYLQTRYGLIYNTSVSCVTKRSILYSGRKTDYIVCSNNTNHIKNLRIEYETNIQEIIKEFNEKPVELPIQNELEQSTPTLTDIPEVLSKDEIDSFINYDVCL